MIDPVLYDQAREKIARTGFNPNIQTKISLLLCSVKNGNLAFQNVIQWLPNLGVVQQFLISQASRELEAVAQLTRTTKWSSDPSFALTAQRILSPLLIAWMKVLMPPRPLLNPQSIYRGLSLGHAQLSRLRLIPIIPDDIDPLDPFAIALKRIEQENGRMLQTQIRLLKNLGDDISLELREQIIAEDQQLVDQVFNEFLAWIGKE